MMQKKQKLQRWFGCGRRKRVGGKKEKKQELELELKPACLVCRRFRWLVALEPCCVRLLLASLAAANRVTEKKREKDKWMRH